MEIRSPGFPIGVVVDAQYQLETVDLEDSDRLYIFSDGAFEQIGASGTPFGTQRLLDELVKSRTASLQSSIDLSLGAVLNSTADDRTDDDITMLGIELSQNK